MIAIELIDKYFPAILGWLIGGSWLVYTILLNIFKLDTLKIITNWVNKSTYNLPILATVILPILFTYLSWQIRYLIQTWELGDFVGVFGAIIGAIFGFLLSELRQWTTEGKQADRVRTMLKLEIEQNLFLLREFWSKASQAELLPEPDFNIAQSFLAISLPQWSRRVWESQVSLLPVALSEEEIKQIHSLYNRLDQIKEKSSQLFDLVSRIPSEIEWGSNLREAAKTSSQVERDWKTMLKGWKELEKVVQVVLDSCNPILG
jgi:hypothetical protein